jgi:hypothetical protein
MLKPLVPYGCIATVKPACTKYAYRRPVLSMSEVGSLLIPRSIQLDGTYNLAQIDYTKKFQHLLLGELLSSSCLRDPWKGNHITITSRQVVLVILYLLAL